MKTIIMDIEGTTTSIDFVHDTLFPFASKHMENFLANHLDDPEVLEVLQQAKEEAMLPSNTRQEDILKTLLQWVQEDRKETSLKSLQGLIWKEGYKSGEIQSHIYPDVPSVLETWSSKFDLGIYSSGSIAAQKLLFSHTEKGNISRFMKFHFDTTSGQKKETTSYTQIAKDIGEKPDQIWFLSDISEELDAAKEAGYKTLQIVRPEDKTTPNQTSHPIAADFVEADKIINGL